jgi:hypothetical protein
VIFAKPPFPFSLLRCSKFRKLKAAYRKKEKGHNSSLSLSVNKITAANRNKEINEIKNEINEINIVLCSIKKIKIKIKCEQRMVDCCELFAVLSQFSLSWHQLLQGPPLRCRPSVISGVKSCNYVCFGDVITMEVPPIVLVPL